MAQLDGVPEFFEVWSPGTLAQLQEVREFFEVWYPCIGPAAGTLAQLEGVQEFLRCGIQTLVHLQTHWPQL